MSEDATAAGDPYAHLRWIDARDLRIDGRGWPEAAHPFRRLPARAEAQVTPAVWKQAQCAAGLVVRFVSDADELWVRWTLAGAPEPSGGICRIAHSGIDCYATDPDGAGDTGRWRWLAAADAWRHPDPEWKLVKGLAPGRRRFALHLPIGNPLRALSIGVPRAATIDVPPPSAQPPLAWYGSSIVQGFHAARPGLPHVLQLARRLDMPLIPLGFAAAAKLEPAIADLLSELDAALYVIDALPNCSPALVAERAETFLRRLRARRPRTPIALVEDTGPANAWARPAAAADLAAKHAAWRAVYDRLRAEGDHALHYLDDLGWEDGEGTVDAIHPDAAGYRRLAARLEAPLRAILAG